MESTTRGAVAEWVIALAWTGSLAWPGSNHTAETSLRNFGNSVYPAFCLSEETLKTVGPFYMVSMPG